MTYQEKFFKVVGGEMNQIGCPLTSSLPTLWQQLQTSEEVRMADGNSGWSVFAVRKDFGDIEVTIFYADGSSALQFLVQEED